MILRSFMGQRVFSFTNTCIDLGQRAYWLAAFSPASSGSTHDQKRKNTYNDFLALN